MMFASPPEQTLEWSDEGVQGAFRFMRRLWKAVYDHVSGRAGSAHSTPERSLERSRRHCAAWRTTTLAKVSDDIGRAPQLQHRGRRGHGAAERDRRFDDSVGPRRAVRRKRSRSRVMVLSPIVPHVCARAVAVRSGTSARCRRAMAEGRPRR